MNEEQVEAEAIAAIKGALKKFGCEFYMTPDQAGQPVMLFSWSEHMLHNSAQVQMLFAVTLAISNAGTYFCGRYHLSSIGFMILSMAAAVVSVIDMTRTYRVMKDMGPRMNEAIPDAIFKAVMERRLPCSVTIIGNALGQYGYLVRQGIDFPPTPPGISFHVGPSS